MPIEPEVDESGWDADDERSSIQELYSPWSLSDALNLYDDSDREWLDAFIKEKMAGADRAPNGGTESEEPSMLELQSGLWRLPEPGSKTKLVLEGFDQWFLDWCKGPEMKGLGLDMNWDGTEQMLAGNDGTEYHQIVEEGAGCGCGSPGPSGTLPAGEENASWYGSACSRRLPFLI